MKATTSQRKGIVSFVRNNYRVKDQLLNPVSEKDKMRLHLSKSILSKYRKREIEILNLPSVWWNFEKTLTYLAPEYSTKLYFTGCERDTETFLCSAKRMPQNKGYEIFHIDSKNTTIATSELATLVNDDIFNFMEDHNSFTYDFIWLDLMCHVTSFDKRLPLVDKVLKYNGTVAITYAAGRESHPIIGSREDMIIDKLVPLGYKVDSQGKYIDGFPMRYMILSKI